MVTSNVQILVVYEDRALCLTHMTCPSQPGGDSGAIICILPSRLTKQPLAGTMPDLWQRKKKVSEHTMALQVFGSEMAHITSQFSLDKTSLTPVQQERISLL